MERDWGRSSSAAAGLPAENQVKLAGLAAAQLAGEDFLVGLNGSAPTRPGSC